MRLIWLSYFDPRKDYKTVWWRSGDLTDAGITTPCRDRGTPRMKCPLKGHYPLIMTAA